MKRVTHVPLPGAQRAGGRLALMLGTVWLAGMALLLWLHARQSVQPPIYDAFTYYFKARAVWQSLASHPLASLLDIAPTFRPPGTVLMAYPFGFTSDFRGLYFRSVFFPVALVFVAAIVAGAGPRPLAEVRPIVILAACFYATIPLFYYFELNTERPGVVSYWGLVDSFLTGLGALATACAVRSGARRSIPFAVASVLLGALTIFVKPAGAILAAVVDVILVVVWLPYFWGELKAAGPSLRAIRRALALMVLLIGISGGAVWLATHSPYLGPGNMAYGRTAVEVMRANTAFDVAALLAYLQGSLGYFIPLGTILLVVIWLVAQMRLPRGRMRGDEQLQLAAALAVLIFGCWFWVFGSGGADQVRYFAPFLFAAVFCALGPCLEAVATLGARTHALVSIWMCAAVLNGSLLLMVPDPSIDWQSFSGVSVVSGSRPASVEQAALVIKSATTPEDVTVYSFPNILTDALFQSEFDLYAMDHATPRFRVARPIDWQRQPTFRINDIVSADYLVFNPNQDAASAEKEGHPLSPFEEESNLFHAWAATLGPDDGTEIVARAPDSELVRITDRVKLRGSLSAMVAAHHWGTAFIEQNPRSWWTEAEIGEVVHAQVLDAPVRFGDVFELHALALQRSINGELYVRAWIRPLAPSVRGDWSLFVHALDATGHGLAATELTVGRPDGAPPDAPYWYLERRFRLPVGASRIGIGIFHGSLKLVADRGERDLQDTRVLLPIPTAANP